MKMVEKLLSNRVLLYPLLLGAVAGAVVTIAGGFYFVYEIVTLIGNH